MKMKMKTKTTILFALSALLSLVGCLGSRDRVYDDGSSGESGLGSCSEPDTHGSFPVRVCRHVGGAMLFVFCCEGEKEDAGIWERIGSCEDTFDAVNEACEAVK